MLSAFGADTLGEFAGEIRMISRNTAKYATVAQANLQGNPPQRQAILTMNGTIEFVGQDELIVNYAVDVYPASTDADLDGYPDVGAVPVVSFTSVDHARRVPIP